MMQEMMKSICVRGLSEEELLQERGGFSTSPICFCFFFEFLALKVPMCSGEYRKCVDKMLMGQLYTTVGHPKTEVVSDLRHKLSKLHLLDP